MSFLEINSFLKPPLAKWGCRPQAAGDSARDAGERNPPVTAVTSPFCERGLFGDKNIYAI